MNVLSLATPGSHLADLNARGFRRLASAGAHPVHKGLPLVVRDALVSFRARSFRAPAAPESLFSCVAKRKVTQREGHPAWRLPGIHARQVREGRPGFSTGHPALAKNDWHPCQSPCGPVVRPSPPHRGPGRAAGHPGPHFSQNPRQELPPHPNPLPRRSRGRGGRSGGVGAVKQRGAKRDAFDLAVLKSAGQDGALLYPGPLCGGESGSTGRAAGIGRKPIPFRQHRDVLSKSPAPAHGLAAQGWAASAKRGGLSLWLSFSLATQRESNSAAEGRRKPFALEPFTLNETRASRTTEGSPLWTRCAPANATGRNLSVVNREGAFA